MADFENAKIEFDCPSCLRTVRAPREQIGSRIVCPHCQRSLVVPVAGKEDLFGDLLGPDSDSTEPTLPTETPPSKTPVPQPEQAADEVQPAGELRSLDEFDFSIPSSVEVDEFLKNKQVPDHLSHAAVDDAGLGHDDDPLSQALLAGLDEIDFPAGNSSRASEDPFDNDPNSPLRIDGISDPKNLGGTITVICPICDTRIIVGADQESARIKCPECYAEITATARKSKKKASWSQPEQPAEGNDENQNPPKSSTRPSSTASANQKAFGIEFDDIKSSKNDRVFDDHEEPLEGTPLAPIEIPTRPHPRFSTADKDTSAADPENESSDELQLAPLEERDVIIEPRVSIEDDPFRIFDVETDGTTADGNPAPQENEDDAYKLSDVEPVLPQPPVTRSWPNRSPLVNDPPSGEEDVDDVEELAENLDSVSSKNNETKEPKSEKQIPPADADRSQPKKSQYQAPPTSYVDPEEERLKNNPLSMELNSLMGMDGKALQWLSRILANIQLLIRLGIALAALTFAYWMFDIIANASSLPEATVASVSVYFVICGLPGFLAAVFGWMLTLAVGGVVFERSGNLNPDIADWPDLSFGEYIPKLIFMVFSLWIAAIPGSFVGLVLLAISKEPVWLAVTGSLTAMLISPLFFFSAFYNGSPFKIISTKALNYFKMSNTDWLLFVPPSFGSWLLFILGTVMPYLPSIIFCFVGAALQILAITIFATFSGVYAGLMIKRIEMTEARQELERAVADRVRTKKKETT